MRWKVLGAALIASVLTAMVAAAVTRYAPVPPPTVPFGASTGQALAATDVAAAFDACRSVTEEPISRCIADTLASGDKDPAATIRAVYAWNDDHPEHGMVCHNVAHYLGQRWTTMYDTATLVELDTGRCDGGLVHGLVEALAFTADDTHFTTTVATVCNRFTEGSPAREQCAHGAGHALVLRNPSSFMTMVDACRVLAEVDQAPCYTAVLMTYAANTASLSTDAIEVEVPRIDPEELTTVCNQVATPMRRKCWEGIWQLYPREIGVDALLVGLVDACEVARKGSFGPDCEASVGQMLFQVIPHDGTPDGTRRDLVEAIGRCPAATLRNCTAGAAASASAWFVALHGSTVGYMSACDDPVVVDVEACRAGESGSSTMPPAVAAGADAPGARP